YLWTLPENNPHPGKNYQRLIVIDLTTNDRKIIHDVKVNNTNFFINDFAWHKGSLWAVNEITGALTRLDIAAIDWTSAATSGVQFEYVGSSRVDEPKFGAMFGGKNGVYGNRNDGGFYKFDLKTGKAVKLSGSGSTQGNDGAKCYNSPLQLPTDFKI